MRGGVPTACGAAPRPPPPPPPPASLPSAAARRPRRQLFFSFEFFPPKTDAGVENLYQRMERMSALEPTFVDVTWGASGTTSETTLEICRNAQKFCGVEVMMHLTCTNMPVGDIRAALQAAKDAGIQNILALRGDPARGADTWQPCEGGFSHAVDLVRFIRAEFGDYFGIGVAGYPEGHLQAASREADLAFLKEKVDAGADLVVTQLFYDADVFLQFVRDARAIGIACPIIPGIMPVQNFSAFKRMTAYSRTRVPEAALARLEAVSADDEAVRAAGAEIVVDMCRTLLDAGVPGLHFYTLNLERSVRAVMAGLGIVQSSASSSAAAAAGAADGPAGAAAEPAAAAAAAAAAGAGAGTTAAAARPAVARRKLPWRPSALPKRAAESVRPIFWANRPKSYLSRTESWDEFPNGRWGDARSPAFGELTDSHFYNFYCGTRADRLAMWGEAPQAREEVYEVFARYVEGSVPRLPWCDSALQLETLSIQRQLAAINRAGFLTINSQPRVNAAPSDDPKFGWGGPGGFVYQKSYVEFFCSPEQLADLIEVARDFPSLTYHAVDHAGNTYSNCPTRKVAAVTWGCFPNREILQPTVVDPESFNVWKDEAFSLWLLLWASLYPEDSRSRELVHDVHDAFFLVNIVDSDFVAGDLFGVFDAVARRRAAAGRAVAAGPHSTES